jgi:hypothetical protein
VCNYFKSSLLYINDETEQKSIKDFISDIRKYRLDQQPYIWLDAVNDKDNWVWSRNNENVSYNNFETKAFDVYWFNKLFFTDPVDPLTVAPLTLAGKCSCFVTDDALWKSCDCSTLQHYICRKQNPTNKVSFNSTEKKQYKKNGKLTSLEKEEDSITISERILMDEEDKLASNLAVPKNNINLEDLKKILASVDDDTVKTVKKFTKDLMEFVTISRKKVIIASDIDSLFMNECHKGFGYYSIKKNDCSMYKKCEYWSKSHALVTLNKCLNGNLFSFEKFQCVSEDKVKCDESSPKFVFIE